MAKITKSIQYGDRTLTIETGEIARQANGAVLVSMDDTVVLVTAVGKKTADASRDFFPLTVNYQEKTYAAGRIPGGYFKREGRPTEKETLVSRLIDRPIRPLFPKGFKNEVQVVASVMSSNPDVDSDVVAMIGASAALAISGIPFSGPIGAARVGYSASTGTYLLNPSPKELEESKLDLVVAGTQDAVLMVESEAKELSEEVMLGAVMYGHEMMQSVIRAIGELAEEVGNARWDWQAEPNNDSLEQQVKAAAEEKIKQAYLIREKADRLESLSAIRESLINELVTEDEQAPSQQEVAGMMSAIEKSIVRDRILSGEARIDGRSLREVRPIDVKTGILPRAHGSALFTRGETQAIVVATLGNQRDAQMVETLTGDSRNRFMLHYNFPPYCVGETGMMSGPKRREIGHGRLAHRATCNLMPSEEEFPYVVRVVSEITESNGSSSMASVCGTSLALMDAGVPVKAPVAGIAMGLVKEGDRFAVLTDILGDEDHLGDMDFKVAGTKDGVTALQMDIKIDGITKEIMAQALEQALEGRSHILGIMNQHITTPREEVSDFAPRIVTMKIKADKIKDVIGKGGSTIRQIVDDTGVDIDIDDDGVVKIFSADGEASEKAKAWIEKLTEEVEVGRVYEGTISKIVDFGAFVNILPGKDGLLHISQICEERVEKVTDKLSEGEVVNVKVLDVDRQGKIKLSMKALLETSEKKEEKTEEAPEAKAEKAEASAEESSSN